MPTNVWAVVAGSTFSLPMEALLGTANQLLGMNAGATALQYKNVKFSQATGQLEVPVGSVAAPSYTFTGFLGTGWYTFGGGALGLAILGVDLGSVNASAWTIKGNLQIASKLLQEDFASDIAVVSGTTNLTPLTGNVVNLTNAAGANAITSLGGDTLPAGTEIETIFSVTGGSVSLTHNAVSLILLGGINIAVVDKDVMRWRKINDASPYWKMVSFQRGTSSSIITAKGDLLVGEDTGGGVIVPSILIAGAEGSRLVTDPAQSKGLLWVPDLPKSIVPNPFFSVNQFLPATSADDTYGHDHWYVLNEANPTAVATQTDQENGQPSNARITQSNAAAQRFGYATIVEGKDCKYLRGQQITFRPRARISASQAIRFAVLEWTGAEDVVTSDVVNAWANAAYTPGNFFLAANITVSGVGAFTPIANTWTDAGALTVTLGSAFNNLIFFVWVEQVAVQNVTLDIGIVRSLRGGMAKSIAFPAFEETLQYAMRYYQKTFSLAVAPAQNAGLTGTLRSLQIVSGVSGVYNFWTFKVPMRIIPTFITFNPSVANAQIRNTGQPSDDTGTGVVAGSTTEWGTVISASAIAGSSATHEHAVHATADARL